MNKLAAILVAMLAVGIGAYLLSDSFGSGNPEPTTKAFTLVVQHRKLVDGESTLTAHTGDTVAITITVDENEELHLHGYDKSVDITAGQPATLTLVANASGNFPFELEHSKTELGSLQVQP